MTTQAELWDQTRAAADKLKGRLKSDPAYVKQYQQDPVGTLLETGMPPEGVIDVLREEGFTDQDVAGFLAPQLAVSLGGKQLGGVGGPTPIGVGRRLDFGSILTGPGGGLAHCGITEGCGCSGCCYTG